jgi:tetratricopeptide (TPR) repeat protein
MFARFRLGQVLESRGEVRKAIEEYERVFDADPSRGMFQMRLPRLLERVGELDKAERRLKSFVALSGESRSSLSILGEFYRRHKRVRELADVEIKLKAARNTVPIPPDQIGREVGKALIGDRWPHCGDRE